MKVSSINVDNVSVSGTCNISCLTEKSLEKMRELFSHN
jgi:hypothetical protein